MPVEIESTVDNFAYKYYYYIVVIEINKLLELID